MMVRLLAFVLHAHEALSFGRGISAEENCSLAEGFDRRHRRAGCEVGQPEEKAIRRAWVARTGLHLHLRRRGATSGGKNLATLERLNNLAVMIFPWMGVAP